MTARRRKLIAAATLLVLAAGMVWWCLGRSGGRMEVKLRFLGFTNDAAGGTCALILVTNTGSTTVVVGYPRIETNEILARVCLVTGPAGDPVPGRLFPAETLTVPVRVANWGRTTFVTCLVTRYGVRERIRVPYMDWFQSVPQTTVAFVGPITNLPPPLRRRTRLA